MGFPKYYTRGPMADGGRLMGSDDHNISFKEMDHELPQKQLQWKKKATRWACTMEGN